MLRALPPGATARVVVRGQLPGPMLETDVVLPHGGSLERTLMLGEPTHPTVYFGGPVGSGWSGQGVMTVHGAVVGHAGSERSAVVTGLGWELPLEEGSQVELWLQRGTERVSQRVRRAWARGRQGPVAFAPLVAGTTRVVWRGAAAAKQLTLTPSNRSGLQSFDPVSTDGEATLVLPNDGSLSANWIFADGSSMQAIWSPEAWAATGELTMDLSDWRSSSVQLSGDLPPTDCWSERGAELVLLPLRPPFGALRAHTLVALPAQVASSTATVPTGRLYWWLRTGCIEGVLAGTVEDAGGAARLLALVSRSAVHHIGAAGQTTRTKLLVEQLDGHDLGGVPLSFRSTFVPPGLRTVRLPQGCRWTSSAP